MKSLLITTAVFIFGGIAYGSAPELEIQGTLKRDGTQSRFKTEKAVVTKVYFVESEDASFRAYVVSWNGSEIVISDMPSRKKKIYEVGDTITFMIHRIDLKREDSTPILSFMLMPEFEMPTKEKPTEPAQ